LLNALCSEQGCTATAHLACLSHHFVEKQPDYGIIPRGGSCPGCSSYVLWGDILRGCHCRHAEITTTPESEEDDDVAELSNEVPTSVKKASDPPLVGNKKENNGKVKRRVPTKKGWYLLPLLHERYWIN
jgi:hypothetical protein